MVSKKLIFSNFESIRSCDFEFVRCVNRTVRVRDGDIVYSGNSLRQLYPSGAIYARLTKSFSTAKVLLLPLL